MSKEIVDYFGSIEAGFKARTVLTVAALVIAAAVALGSVVVVRDYMREQSGMVYVLDQGQPLLAYKEDASMSVEARAYQHVRLFHTAFFSLVPDKNAIEYNIEQALLMADKSAYNYYTTMSERGYYERLVAENVMQQVVIDSVLVNTSAYPYKASCYGTVYAVRANEMQAYYMETSCSLITIPFTPEHPTGLLLERFKMVRWEDLGQRKRN